MTRGLQIRACSISVILLSRRRSLMLVIARPAHRGHTAGAVAGRMTTALSASCSLSNITLILPPGASQIAARFGTKNTHTRATYHDLVKPADVRSGVMERNRSRGRALRRGARACQQRME